MRFIRELHVDEKIIVKVHLDKFLQLLNIMIY